VQRVASAAKHDGLQHPLVVLLAGLGTSGKHEGNVARDLDAFLRRYLKVDPPTPTNHGLPLKILKGAHAGVHMIPTAFLLPHILLSFLWTHFRPIFEDRLLGAPGALVQFWSQMDTRDPRLQTSKHMFRSKDYSKTVVPLMLHGDGVPCTNHGSVDVISFES